LDLGTLNSAAEPRLIGNADALFVEHPTYIGDLAFLVLLTTALADED
jgi:hypothetical protein